MVERVGSCMLAEPRAAEQLHAGWLESSSSSSSSRSGLGRENRKRKPGGVGIACVQHPLSAPQHKAGVAGQANHDVDDHAGEHLGCIDGGAASRREGRAGYRSASGSGTPRAHCPLALALRLVCNVTSAMHPTYNRAFQEKESLALACSSHPQSRCRQ